MVNPVEQAPSNNYDRQDTIGINTLTVNGVDVRMIIVSFDIFEDIFAHFTTIELVLLDPISLTDDPGIFSGETLEVDFESTSSGGFPSYAKTFKIYKISNMAADGSQGKNRIYAIHGVTEGAFTDANKRLSRTYKDMPESSIVADICSNVLNINPVDIEASKFDRRITIPNWRPIKVIQELSRTAVRAGKYPAANYVFYEDKDKFNFCSLDKKLEQGPAFTITHQISAQVDNTEYARLNAKSFQNNNNFDYFRNVDNGMYGTRSFLVDLSNKEYMQEDYVYSSEFGKQVHIDGSNAMLMEGPPSFPEQRILLNPNEKFPEKDFASFFAEKYKHKRKGMMQQFNNYEFLVDVDGDTNVKLGDVVEFELPAFDSRNDVNGAWQEREDEKLSKNYLVAQIKHECNNNEHRMLLGLIKPHLLNSG